MSRILRDGIIGISDGLTVPFILVAGLCGAGAGQSTILIVGLAGILCGAIAMALGGYFTFRSESEHLSEMNAQNSAPLKEAERVTLSNFGLDEEIQSLMAQEKIRDQEQWQAFQKQFELNDLPSDRRHSWQKALVIGVAFFIGGLIPLGPYLLIDDPKQSLIYSGVFTGIALLGFGIYKSRKSGRRSLSGVLFQFLMAMVGGAAAFYIGRLIA